MRWASLRHLAADAHKEIALEGLAFFLGIQDLRLQFLQFGCGESFGVHQRLLAFIVLGGEMEIRPGDLDVIAKDAVEPDLERGDAGALALAGFDPGHQLFAVLAEVAEFVKRGVVTLADQSTLAQKCGWVRVDGCLDQLTDVREFVEILAEVPEAGRLKMLEVGSKQRKRLERLLQGQQVTGVGGFKRHLAEQAFEVLLALKQSFQALPLLRTYLQHFQAARLRDLRENLDELADVRELIETSIHPDPPALLGEGGLIRQGYNAALDELRDLSQNSKQLMARIEARERERTGIASLKVRFNSVFGYYIEISRANLHLAPEDYERKQTLVNAERFTTSELKELEAKILDAEEKSQTLERDLFVAIRRQVANEAHRIRQTAAVLAELDVLACFAHLAGERSYHRPEFSDDGELVIQQGRHPVIELMSEEGPVRPVRSERSLHERRHRPDLDHYRPEHGRKVHLSPPGSADRFDGPNGQLRPRGAGPASHFRPHFHPHRRFRQPGARALDVHGGND